MSVLKALQFQLQKRKCSRKSAGIAVMTFLSALAFQNCGPSQFSASIEDVPAALELSSSLPESTTVTTLPSTPNATIPPTPNTTLPSTPIDVRLIESASSTLLAVDSVTGVHEGEVFQRKDNGLASIRLTLKKFLAGEYPYYSISLLNSAGGIERQLKSGQRSGSELTFELATGLATRKVRLSFHDDRGLERVRWVSPGFSVGEVFLVSGQSNSSNHGEAPTASQNPLNKGVDPVSKSWVAMKDPLPYATSWAFPEWGSQKNPGGSPWPAFADDLSNKLQVPVAVVSLGWGGSALAWWLPGHEKNYFSRLVTGAQAVPSCGFRAMLWHEGESDSMGRTSTSLYKSDFLKMVSAFRSATGCQQPWLVAQATWLHSMYWIQNYHVSESEAGAMKWKAEVDIRQAQRELGLSASLFPGPDTDLIVSHKYRYDDLHFSMLGLSVHGKMWSQKVLSLLGKPSLKEIDLIPELRTVWNAYQTVLHRTTAEMEKDWEGIRYWNERLSTGAVTEMQLMETLRNSDEGFIRQVYQDSFGRQPTPSELLRWQSQLSSGAVTSRTQLKAAILQSP